MKSSHNKFPNLWDCELNMSNEGKSVYAHAATEHGKEMFQGPQDGLPLSGGQVQVVHPFANEDTGITYTAPQYSSTTPRSRYSMPGPSAIGSVSSYNHPHSSLSRGQSFYGTKNPELAIPPEIYGENGKRVGKNKESTVLEKLLVMEKQVFNIFVRAEEVEFGIREEKLYARYFGYFDGGEIFPAKSLAHLEKLEYMMQSDAWFESSVVLLMRKIGSLNSKCFVQKMLAYTVSGNVAAQFTLTGRIGMKLAFQKTHLCVLLYRAAKSHPIHKSIEYYIFLSWISEWLQKSDSRNQKGSSSCPLVLTID